MTPRTHLLIANQTLGGPELRRVIEDRLAAGPCHFHVVVPAARREGFMKRTIDAYGGGRDAHEVNDDRAAAELRLAAELDRLRALGAEVEGVVGDVDPLVAAAEALGDRSFDEVIVSTLPAGVSQWVGMDLPRRLERVLGCPVTHVEGPAAL
jgi:hypothetical protein